jgi:hypothetical protein
MKVVICKQQSRLSRRGCLTSPRLRGAVRGKYWDSQQTLGAFELLALTEHRDSEIFRTSLRGITSPRLRGEVGSHDDAKHRHAIRVRGRLGMGRAGDKKVIDALNHRCRVVFLGAPSPGARAFHARTPTSPRTRGEVRNSPCHDSNFEIAGPATGGFLATRQRQ